MSLSMAVDEPGRVLGQGEHLGFEWMVLHNNAGYRCGYVRVMPGHPWHGLGYNAVRDVGGDYPDVHGGLTFASDDGQWFGFDCAHCDDGPDPDLPNESPFWPSRFGHVWSQGEVEAECLNLCKQASASYTP